MNRVWRSSSTLGSLLPEALIRRPKKGIGGGIALSGTAATVHRPLANGLLDELRLLAHSIVVGRGRRSFEDSPTHEREPAHSAALGSGVLNPAYTPACRGAAADPPPSRPFRTAR